MLGHGKKRLNQPTSTSGGWVPPTNTEHIAALVRRFCRLKLKSRAMLAPVSGFCYFDLDSLITSRISFVDTEVFTPGTSNGDFGFF